MYERYELTIIDYDENRYVVCSYSDGGDEGWSAD